MSECTKRPWVAYVGPFPYPSGAAASRRVLGVAQSLVLGGMDVVIASGAACDSTRVEQEPGISWCHLGERVAEHWPQPLRRFRYALMGARTVEWLMAQPVPPVAVILYSGYTPYLQRLLPWCRRNGVRLLFDAVEWYEPESRLGYLTSPYQWNIEWAMRRLIPKVDGVIAISSYLARYYRNLDLPVAIVPATTRDIAGDITTGPWLESKTLRLVYAGSPGGNKDLLGTVLHAVRHVADAGADVQLTVAGPQVADVAALLGVSALDGLDWLRALGPLSYEGARHEVATADFSVLLREDRRLAHAGFPTKFVESFASGTPVIANVTSDLGQHLRHGQTGLVCADSSEAAMMECLQEALVMPLEAKRLLRGNCLAHARAAFAPEAYADALATLVLPAMR